MPSKSQARKKTPALRPLDADRLDTLHLELSRLIGHSRQRFAVAVNAELTQHYWHLGERLHRETLGGSRATYGARVVDQIGQRLAADYGRGFETKNLRRMITFAQAFPDREIVATLSRQLGWSHLKELLPLKDPHARAFYARSAGNERAAELKIGRYKAAYKGPIELYVRSLDRANASPAATSPPRKSPSSPPPPTSSLVPISDH